MSGWKQAQKPFTPRNPEKYVGDRSKLLYKSSWEEYAFNFLDNNTKVIKWAYEPIKISYLKPVPRSQFTPNGLKPSNYFPDFFVEYIDRSGNTIKELIEVKPLKQLKNQSLRMRKLAYRKTMCTL